MVIFLASGKALGLPVPAAAAFLLPVEIRHIPPGGGGRILLAVFVKVEIVKRRGASLATRKTGRHCVLHFCGIWRALWVLVVILRRSRSRWSSMPTTIRISTHTDDYYFILLYLLFMKFYSK